MNWHTDLSYGKRREQDFLKLVPFLGLKALEGTGPDFVDGLGQFYELKSERRSAGQTGNIAVEVVSSFKRKGAIFTAAAQSTFIAFFYSCDSVFIYKSEELLRVARAYRRKYGQNDVRNSNAKIVLLPRRLLKRIEVYSVEIGR